LQLYDLCDPDLGSGHTVYRCGSLSTSTYIPNFVQSGKHLWMDGETPRPATLGCDVYEVTEIMVDNAGIGQMTSPNEDR